MSEWLNHPTRKSDLVWAGMLGAMVAYETYTLKRNLDHTLSRTTRRTFKTHHPVGKAVWVVGWGWFSTWMMKHILEIETDPLDILLDHVKEE